MSQILKPKKGYKKVNLKPKYFEVEIPLDWEITTLDRLTKNHNSGVFKNKEFYGSGVNIVGVSDLYDHDDVDGQIFRLVRLTDEEKENHDLKEGDLIYGESSLVRTGIGKTLVVTKQGEGTYFAWHTRRLTVNEKVLPKFISYMLNLPTLRNSIVNRSTTTALTGITTKDYFATNFPFPPSLPEQQKIATILSNIDNFIINTQKIINQTKSVKKGLMQKLLIKGIGHKKFKKVEWLFGKEIEIPEEWEVVKLHRIVDKIIDMNHRMPKKLSEGIPFLTTGYISKNIHSVLSITPTNSELEYISQKDFEIESKKFNAEKGDILFTRYGTLGITKFIDSNQKFLASYSVALIKIQNSVDGLFLTNFLNSNYVKQQIVFLREQTSNNNLHLSKISQIKIILSPEKEQQKIVSIISNVESQIKSQTQYKEKLDRLKKSLMQKLLTGLVRVKI